LKSPGHNALWLLLSLCVCATTWLYVHRIAGPWTDAKELQKGGLKAQMGDLYPRWVGARELLVHGRNPYSAEVSQEIQMAYYGHIVTAEETRQHVVDEQRFAYPIYVILLMAPTIDTDFAKVHYWAPFALALFAGLSVLFCIRILDWNLAWTTGVALVLFAVSSPQIVQGMRHQQLAVVVGCFLVAAAWCVHERRLGAAGALLAFSTIKPQMAALPLIWFFIWAIGEWRTRNRLLIGFGVTLAVLFVAGEIFVPTWPIDFLTGMAAYRNYFPTTSVLRLVFGDWLGIAVSLVIVGWTLAFGWRNRKTSGDSREFAWAFSAFLIVAVITFPLFTPFNQALLILPAMLVVREWMRLPRLSQIAFAVVVAWPWITSAILLLAKVSPNPQSWFPLIPAFAASAFPLLLSIILSTTKKSDQLSMPVKYSA
jgi:hypothetical protein